MCRRETEDVRYKTQDEGQRTKDTGRQARLMPGFVLGEDLIMMDGCDGVWESVGMFVLNFL